MRRRLSRHARTASWVAGGSLALALLLVLSPAPVAQGAESVCFDLTGIVEVPGVSPDPPIVAAELRDSNEVVFVHNGVAGDYSGWVHTVAFSHGEDACFGPPTKLRDGADPSFATADFGNVQVISPHRDTVFLIYERSASSDILLLTLVRDEASGQFVAPASGPSGPVVLIEDAYVTDATLVYAAPFNGYNVRDPHRLALVYTTDATGDHEIVTIDIEEDYTATVSEKTFLGTTLATSGWVVERRNDLGLVLAYCRSPMEGVTVAATIDSETGVVELHEATIFFSQAWAGTVHLSVLAEDLVLVFWKWFTVPASNQWGLARAGRIYEHEHPPILAFEGEITDFYNNNVGDIKLATMNTGKAIVMYQTDTAPPEVRILQVDPETLHVTSTDPQTFGDESEAIAVVALRLYDVVTVFSLEGGIADRGVIATSACLTCGTNAELTCGATPAVAGVSDCVACEHPTDGKQGEFDASTSRCTCQSGFAPSAIPTSACGCTLQGCQVRAPPLCHERSEPQDWIVTTNTFIGGEYVLRMEIPMRETRRVTWITFGGNGVCDYPGPNWAKSLDNQACRDVFTLRIDAADFADQCNVDISVSAEPPSFTRATPRSFADGAVMVAKQGVGVRDFVATSYIVYAMEVRIVSRVPGADLAGNDLIINNIIQISTYLPNAFSVSTAIVVRSEHNLAGFVSKSAWVTRDLPEASYATLQLQTQIDWPYYIDYLEIKSAPEVFVVEVEEITALRGPCADNAYCQQLWAVTVRPPAGAESCALDGTYAFTAELGCRGDDSEQLACTTDLGELIMDGLVATDMCQLAFLDLGDSVTGELRAYSTSFYRDETTEFFLGGTAYLELEVTSALFPISDIELSSVLVYPTDAAVPQPRPVDITGSQQQFDTTLRFSFPLVAGAFDGLNDGETKPYNIIATVAVEYNDGSRGRLRNTGESHVGETTINVESNRFKSTEFVNSLVNGTRGGSSWLLGAVGGPGVAVLIAGTLVAVGVTLIVVLWSKARVHRGVDDMGDVQVRLLAEDSLSDGDDRTSSVITSNNNHHHHTTDTSSYKQARVMVPSVASASSSVASASS